MIKGITEYSLIIFSEGWSGRVGVGFAPRGIDGSTLLIEVPGKGNNSSNDFSGSTFLVARVEKGAGLVKGRNFVFSANLLLNSSILACKSWIFLLRFCCDFLSYVLFDQVFETLDRVSNSKQIKRIKGIIRKLNKREQKLLESDKKSYKCLFFRRIGCFKINKLTLENPFSYI